MEQEGKLPASMRRPKHLTIVIKVGSSSIVDEKTHQPILSILSLIVETSLTLRNDGHRVVIVSSGAIAVGLKRMDLARRPKHLPQVQALAAIGQSRLMSLWDSLFSHVDQKVAQILLTRNDIADRTQYLNAQNTLRELLNMDVIPIVNENDTLAVTEIKFGDNDTLSAITAAMVHADYLFLMTDVDCLYDKNPRKFPDAQPIEQVPDIDALQADVSSAGSSLGTGGMATKIVAARLATSAGTTTIITRSSKPNNVSEIIRYLHPPPNPTPLSPQKPSLSRIASSTILPNTEASLKHTSTTPPPLHTRFLPSTTPIRNRAFWILHGLAPHGTIYIDRGATAALSNKAGLLPVGVLGVDGHFAQQEAVRLVAVDRHSAAPLPLMGSLAGSENLDRSESSGEEHARALPRNGRPLSVNVSLSALAISKGEEVGRAVVNYSSAEVVRIKGLRSSEIEGVLGYADSEYVAFRENVSLFAQEKSRPETPLGRRTPEAREVDGLGTPLKNSGAGLSEL